MDASLTSRVFFSLEQWFTDIYPASLWACVWYGPRHDEIRPWPPIHPHVLDGDLS